MGAVAFQKGLGAVHSLSHPLGAIYGTHHGLLNAVLLPYVLEFNKNAIAEKMERLSSYLQLKKPGFEGIMEWVVELRQVLDIPATLSKIGIDDGKIDEVVSGALKDPTASTNPIALTDASLRALFQVAILGQ